MTIKIVIRERGNDYMAFIEGHPEIWGCGKGVVSAVGDLILSHQDVCDINIEYEKDNEKPEKEEPKMEQKMEHKTLEIGQEIVCPKHGSQIIEEIDDTVPQEAFYVLSCGDIHPTETKEENKPKIGRKNR